MTNKDKNLFLVIVKTFSIRVFSALFVFLLNVYIARLLDIELSGVFFLAITIMVGLSIICRFGLDNAIVRYASIAWKEGDYSRVKGIYLQACLVVGGISCSIALILWFSAPWLSSYVFNNEHLLQALRVSGIALIPYSLSWVCSSFLKAFRRPAISTFIESGGLPLFAILMFTVWFAVYREVSLIEAMIMYMSASILVVSMGFYLIWKSVPESASYKMMGRGVLLQTCLPMLLVAVFNYLSVWSPTIFLGMFSTASDVSLYNIAFRTAMLTSLILFAVVSVVTPRYAILYKENKMAELEKLAVRSTVLVTIGASPILLVFVIKPDLILSIFGAEFVKASLLLQIIAIGQFVNVLTGTVGALLQMSGKEHILKNILFATTVFTILSSFFIIPIYGGIGAAIITAVALSIISLAASWYVYKSLGVLVMPGGNYIRRIIAADNIVS